jgi:hypothetical protein
MRERAIRENLPLIVYVNTPRFEINGVLSLSLDSFDGVQDHGLVLGVPYRGQLYRSDLPANSSPAQILAEIHRLNNGFPRWFASGTITSIPTITCVGNR